MPMGTMYKFENETPDTENKQYYTEKNCLYCRRALVAIGERRTNGKKHSDWKTRKVHKKCLPGYEHYQTWLKNEAEKELMNVT